MQALWIGIAACLSSGATTAWAQSSVCEPAWLPTFGGMPGVDGPLQTLVVFDDQSGAGPQLYAGGTFTLAGGVVAKNVARWDGRNWSALGSGLNDSVLDLAVFDDGSGSGPALYAAGTFLGAGTTAVGRIAKWDGQSWSALGAGFPGPSGIFVDCLTVFDDGSGAGPALHAGGNFTSAGGAAASRIAKWNGQSWSPLGPGLDGSVSALAVFDDGSGAGAALYVGGNFTTAGGVAAQRVARWNGMQWSALGSGLGSSSTSFVADLRVHDDGTGSGPALYAGGEFTTAGGLSANRIAKWDGLAWAPLGAGLAGGLIGVSRLVEYDDGSGSGPELYVLGGFTSAGGVPVNRIAKWDGLAWSPVGSGLIEHLGGGSLAVYDDGTGSGERLYVGGGFTNAGGLPVARIAAFDGQSWSALGAGLNEFIEVVATFDDGTGPALYVGGNFTSAGGLPASRVAKWDGQGWKPLGSGVDSVVRALAVFDDGSGSGPALYVGGQFNVAGGVSASRIARWNGMSWSPLTAGNFNGAINALLVHDDGSGSGPALYAGGQFGLVGGVSASRIAKWNGQAWGKLGLGVDATVHTLVTYDDGSGPALYVAGEFTFAGGFPANHIAKWNGASWSALGSGTDSFVQALAVHDEGDGSGPSLIAGGLFTFAGGSPANRIARWNGQHWSALGSGFNNTVGALQSFDDGSGAGPRLFATGNFTTAGGVAANTIAAWGGQSWSALGSGIEPFGAGFFTSGLALGVYEGGGTLGPALVVGGLFGSSPGGDSFLARWGCAVPAFTGHPGCLGNPAILSSPSAALALGSPVTFDLQSNAGLPGLCQLFLGQIGLSGGGCGLPLPGFGELLLALAPEPLLIGSVSTATGQAQFGVAVPASPQLVGLSVGLQGVYGTVALGTALIELSNGLSGVISL